MLWRGAGGGRGAGASSHVSTQNPPQQGSSQGQTPQAGGEVSPCTEAQPVKECAVPTGTGAQYTWKRNNREAGSQPAARKTPKPRSRESRLQITAAQVSAVTCRTADTERPAQKGFPDREKTCPTGFHVGASLPSPDLGQSRSGPQQLPKEPQPARSDLHCLEQENTEHRLIQSPGSTESRAPSLRSQHHCGSVN